MAAGYSVTKGELDAKAGDIARSAQRLFKDVATLQTYLLRTADADLEALGYSPGDVAILKSAFADLSQLTDLWTGTATLAQVKDFRTFVSQLWGVGAY